MNPYRKMMFAWYAVSIPLLVLFALTLFGVIP